MPRCMHGMEASLVVGWARLGRWRGRVQVSEVHSMYMYIQDIQKMRKNETPKPVAAWVCVHRSEVPMYSIMCPIVLLSTDNVHVQVPP